MYSQHETYDENSELMKKWASGFGLKGITEIVSAKMEVEIGSTKRPKQEVFEEVLS